MKKFGSFVLTAVIAVRVLTSAAAAQNSEEAISVSVNGAAVDFSRYDNMYPYLENETIWIPIRAIAEGMGLTVGWDEAAQSVSITGRDEILLTVDSDTAVVNKETVSLEQPVRMANDRTFVPLSFAADYLGVNAQWDETSNSISIEQRKGGGQGMGNGITAGAQGDRQPVTETNPEILAVIKEGAEKFAQFTFEDEETGTALEYSLYIPEGYDGTEEYPLLLYIPDASAASKSAKEIVEQYYGADIWVTDEEQEKHPSFILVPAFSEVVVDDNWNTSGQIDTLVKLLNGLMADYRIDTDRLYTTGQSMGCMTSLYLNSKYPDLFAASLFVSGQWDISVLQPLEEQKFFYITAGGDEKASGGQDEVRVMFDADGVGYSYGTWNAQNLQEEQNAAAESLIAQGYQANMIRFEKGSVLTEGSGMEHNASFNYGYKIPAVRDWLFAQTKSGQ